LEQPGAAIRPLVEAREKTKCLQVRSLNHIFGIFLVFHQPDYSTIKVYRHSMTFIPVPFLGRCWSGIIPGRNRYGPDEGRAPARCILSTRIQKPICQTSSKKIQTTTALTVEDFSNVWPGQVPALFGPSTADS